MPLSLNDLPGLKVSAEDLLATVLETTAQPTWIVDPDDVIRFANPAAVAALGYDNADELLGRPSHETIGCRQPDRTPYPAAESPTLAPRASGETVTREMDWFCRRDGSLFPVSYVAAPFAMPEGRGAVVAFTDIGDRVQAEQVRREHDAIFAAQRRVATLIAGGAASADVFAAIAREVGLMIGLPLVALWRYEPDRTAVVLGAWSERPHPFQAGTRWPLDGPTICAQVLDTGRPARIDDFAALPGTIADAARATGIRACAGAPIIVDGDVWGAMSADLTDAEPLPEHIEDRLAELTELVATAISNTASQAELARLADEQAALRRVATLVARDSPPGEVFALAAEELGRLLGAYVTTMCRYEGDDMITVVAESGDAAFPVGTRLQVDAENVGGLVLRTGRPARVDDYSNVTGSFGSRVRAVRLRSAVGCPIVVDGRLWGVMIVASRQPDPLPAAIEPRIAEFTELVATAISNTEARAQKRRLADEQAALRRMATLVAQGVPPPAVFAAVAREVGLLLGVEWTHLARYEGDRASIAVGGWSPAGDQIPVGTRVDLSEGESVGGSVLRTGRPARMRDYEHASGPAAALGRQRGLRSSVGAPIVVDQRLWGMLMVASKGDLRLPDDTESRIAAFAELVATAISNTEARTEVAQLADEQAALRHVATLVARGAPPDQVFAAVTEEVERLLPVEHAIMGRFESDGMVAVASSATAGNRFPVGGRWTLGGKNVSTIVGETGRPARIDSYADASGTVGLTAREMGYRSSVGSPIIVEGRLWGVIAAASVLEQPLPADTEERLASFTELVATAIANAESRAALAASRARIVAATDETRRRIERDLHDGTQQRLVSLMLGIRAAEAAESPDVAELTAQLSRTALGLGAVLDELREISRGIHPAILSEEGLVPAIEALARRSAVPVELDLRIERRLREPVEVAAYYVISEALTNAAKHAEASFVNVELRADDAILRVVIRDDGVGGAAPAQGSGLAGLTDRIEALGGSLDVSSPPGAGTALLIALPVEAEPRSL